MWQHRPTAALPLIFHSFNGVGPEDLLSYIVDMGEERLLCGSLLLHPSDQVQEFDVPGKYCTSRTSRLRRFDRAQRRFVRTFPFAFLL